MINPDVSRSIKNKMVAIINNINEKILIRINGILNDSIKILLETRIFLSKTIKGKDKKLLSD